VSVSAHHDLDAPPLRALLRLTLTPGLGPVLAGRLIERYGSPEAVAGLSPKALEQVRGIGASKASMIARGIREADRAVDRELTLAGELGVRMLWRGHPEFPPLLEHLIDAPLVLSIMGDPAVLQRGRFAVGIVGSRRSSAYGIEQAERFSSTLARAGLVIVSGGALGVDSAAHRAALAAGGATVAVLGCGLARCYPPDNAGLFRRIADGGPDWARGAVVSELPLLTSPEAKNFPARNRLISGLSLGVLVVEAGVRSGALITARIAAEEHGREVMALPGRVDSPSCRGSLGLLKSGGAAMVTEPGDVIELLEAPARHLHSGVHHDRYGPALVDSHEPNPAQRINRSASVSESSSDLDSVEAIADGGLDSRARRAIVSLLRRSPMALDELVERAGLDPGLVQAELSMLEIQGLVRRAEGRFGLSANHRACRG